MTTLSSPAFQRQVHSCPWCGETTDREGICDGCERRLALTNVYTREGQAPLPIFTLLHVRRMRHASLNIYRVFALLCEHGFISNWIRPDVAAYATDLGMTRQAVYRAIGHMVDWGWIDARKIGLKKKTSPSVYRLAILPEI